MLYAQSLLLYPRLGVPQGEQPISPKFNCQRSMSFLFSPWTWGGLDLIGLLSNLLSSQRCILYHILFLLVKGVS